MKITIELDDAETALRMLEVFGPSHVVSGYKITAEPPTETEENVKRVVDTPTEEIEDDGFVTVTTTAPGNDEPDPNETDIHGMTWREDIHSSPPSKNADGSWRAKRGKKAEYEAAIAEAKGEPEPVSEPEPASKPAMPAAPEPTTPEEPVEYETMAKRFIAMMESGKITDFEAIYNALDVSYDDIETNQTSLTRLWAYMDALDNDEPHDNAIRHALGQ